MNIVMSDARNQGKIEFRALIVFVTKQSMQFKTSYIWTDVIPDQFSFKSQQVALEVDKHIDQIRIWRWPNEPHIHNPHTSFNTVLQDQRFHHIGFGGERHCD